MRILIAVHGFPPTFTGGAEGRADRTSRWLIKQGHSVEVFTVESISTPGFRLETREDNGLTVHRLYYSIKDTPAPFRAAYDHAPIGEALGALLKERPFDLVHLISGYLLGTQVIYAAHQAGLPVVVTLTEYWFMCVQLNLIRPTHELCIGPESDQKCARCIAEEKRRYRLPAQWLPGFRDGYWALNKWDAYANQIEEAVAQRRVTLREALDSVELAICPSQFLKQKFAEYGFDTQRFVHIRQGVRTRTGDVARAERRPADPLRIGYMGQIKSHKGVDLLIEAATQLLNVGQPLSLDIWGNENEDPHYVQDLKRKTSNYANIRWNGVFQGGSVWDVLAKTDVIVVPSRWYENSPNVILEAHHMGIPVIATNLGGMAELVKHEVDGLLFGLNDSADLARQISRLIREPDLLPKLQAGIQPVATVDAEMNTLVEHYSRVSQGSLA